MLYQEFTYKDYARVRYDEGRMEGREEGIEKGREIGRTEGEIAKTLTIAHNALTRGMPIADIADLTGLTYREIENLRNLN